MDDIEVNNLITDKVSILNGLTKTIQKEIDSKYFYDSKGSELFDEITKLKEYYPTKKELTILKEKKTFYFKNITQKSISHRIWKWFKPENCLFSQSD